MDWITTFEALKKVYMEDAYSNIAINDAIKNHKLCKPDFVRNFAKGVIRETIKLDYFISKFAEKGINKIKARTLVILRMGFYATLYLDSVPDYAVVSESVKLAKKVAKGTDGFINAMLRNFNSKKDEIEIPEDRLDIKYSIKADLVNLLKEQYPGEIENILNGFNMINPLTLRVNTLKTSVNDALDYLKSIGIKAKKIDNTNFGISCEKGEVLNSDWFKDGMFTVQGAASMQAIEELSPKKDSKLLDMCSAPGGKSTAAAEIMNNQGEIVACDIYSHKLELIEKTANRLGINIIKTRTQDASEFCEEFIDKFDYVIADVPCSGLGVISNKPEIKYRANIEEYVELYDLQKNILKNAISYVKVGGIIEYSTCTINKKENEKIINAIKNEYNNIQILEKKLILPYNKVTGFFFCTIKRIK